MRRRTRRPNRNRQFPKRLYVKWECPDDNDSEPFLLAAEDAREHVTGQDSCQIGVYVLIEEATVRTNVEVRRCAEH